MAHTPPQKKDFLCDLPSYTLLFSRFICFILFHEILKFSSMISTPIFRVQIQAILDDIMDIREPAERNSVEHCYTMSGLSGSEATCKVKIVEKLTAGNVIIP